jgi:transcriptional regulator with XRE-family HTH domain
MKPMTKTIFAKRIGLYFKSIRDSRNISQEKFAEILGVHRNYVGSIERGERNISVYMLLNLLSKLSITIVEFERESLLFDEPHNKI